MGELDLSGHSRSFDEWTNGQMNERTELLVTLLLIDILQLHNIFVGK